MNPTVSTFVGCCARAASGQAAAPPSSGPGGNVTGATSINVELGPKRLELMRELLPSVSSMALLVNPTTPALAEPSTRITQAAAHALGLELHVLQARNE